MKHKNLAEAVRTLIPTTSQEPSLHIVLGSGLAGAVDQAISKSKEWKSIGEISFSDLSSIPQTSVQGHKGTFRFLTHIKSRRSLVLQTGRLHGYEGHEPEVVVTPLREVFDLGCRTFILTNAAGSLQKTAPAGSAMIITDHVNLTGKNPLLGPNPKDALNRDRGERFPDMSEAYSLKLSAKLKTHLKKKIKRVSEGVYLGVLGPSFETPAEVKLFSKWGLGAVGMSTVWETIALRHMGAEVAGVSFLSNLGAGLSKKPLSHEEVLATGKKTADLLMQALLNFAADFMNADGQKSVKRAKK